MTCRERKERPTRTKRLRLPLGLALMVAVLLGALPSLASAAAPAFEVTSIAPNSVTAGEPFSMSVSVENTGNAPFSGDLTITDVFPSGVVPLTSEGASCTTVDREVTCTSPVEGKLPGGQVQLGFTAMVEAGAEGDLINSVTASGGGVAEDVSLEDTLTVGPPKPFGFSAFGQSATNADGTPAVQAGSSPDSALNVFKVQSFMAPLGGPGGNPANAPVEQFRTVIAHLPPGLVANLNATASRCTAAQLNTPAGGIPSCPDASQVGFAAILFGYRFNERQTTNLYNMVPPPGVAAEFGFYYVGVPIVLEARVRPGDYGFDIVVRNINVAIPLLGSALTFWGVPADASHDTRRGACWSSEGNTGSYCPLEEPVRRAFLRLPTSCTGPLPWSQEVDSYAHPGTFVKAETTTPAQTGCNQLDFSPALTAKPSTNLGDSPAGLEFNLHLPQNEDPDGLAEAHLKDLRVELPEGLTVNPASADGLGVCSPQQIGLVTPVGQVPPSFNGSEPQCPDSSKLGNVVVNAPAVGHDLPGLAYLASQNQNPFGSLLAMYVVIDDPQTGIRVKVATKIEADPNSGQLTAVVPESPQLPFEDLELQLDQGAHAALRTPISCGNFTTTSEMTPWSTPEGQDAHPTDSFQIVKGAGGGACVASEAAAPGQPSFEAGTLEPKAGAYSPLVLKLARKDGTQQITGIDTTMAPGLLGRLAGLSYCPEAALQGAAQKSGKEELSSPSCPAASEVGTVHVAAGAGPAPLNVPGKAYLTGPYKGAPIGLAVITPAVAGPFDLGTVVVRTAMQIDPETARVRAVSDQLPHILAGIPLDIRSISLRLERPSFTLNPTSCDPMQITGAAALLTGQGAALSSPFQVGGCANLPFKPKLELALKGGTTRGKHPALRATVTYPKAKGANIARASVALPRSQLLDQAHIGTVCTRVRFAADDCPARSIYGKAKAISPLLDKPLAGPVYLRSSNNKLPDLVADLRGQIRVVLVGRIDQLNGGIRTTFASVPDAPVYKFVLSMKGGKKGLLQNSTNLCRGTRRATVLFDAHNGKIADQRPVLRARCAKKASKRGEKHRR